MAIAGAVGAILTVYIPLSQSAVSQFGLEGAWFGVALGAYFWMAARGRPRISGLAFIPLSAAAFFLAFMTAFGVTLVGGYARATPVKVPAVALLAAGTLGAAVVSGAAFLLFIDTRRRVAPALAICTLAGGALGVAGHRLGETLQSGSPQEAFTFGVLCLVWQTGVALVMGLVWPEQTGTELSLAPQPAPRRRIPIVAAVLMVLVTLPLVWSLVQGMRGRAYLRRTEASVAAYKAEQPSLQNLPPVVARPYAEAMILDPIGTYHVRELPLLRHPANAIHPEFVDYRACYSDTGGDACAAISVQVVQYATAEWARFALRGTLVTGSNSGTVLDPAAATPLFNQRVLEGPRQRPGRDVYWISGPHVIRIESWFVDANPVIRAYLERYPSAL